MSELVQVKKLLTFEEICPRWAAKLKHGITDDHVDSPLIMSSHRLCIVGEANGFSDDYVRRSLCIDCDMHSMRLYKRYGGYSIDEDPHGTFEQDIFDFVKHFNECHVTLTGPDCR